MPHTIVYALAFGLSLGFIAGVTVGIAMSYWITAPRQNGTSAKMARD